MTKLRVEANLFGTFQIITPYETIYADEFSSPSLVKLLAFFLLNYGREIRVQELIDMFWRADEIANPTGALKNLVYRLRQRLDRHGFAGAISSGKGFYKMFDENVELRLDVRILEDCIKRLDVTDDESESIAISKEAVSVYKGRFMKDFSSEIRVYNQSIFYENKILSIYKELLKLLNKQQRYDELFEYSTRALAYDSLEEELYEYNIIALYQMGKQEQAIKTYQNAMEHIYQNLGVGESIQMQELYKQIINRQSEKKEKIEDIKELLKENDIKGAYLCEYEIFKRMYQLELRRGERSGLVPYLSLINIELKSPFNMYGDKKKEILISEMEALQNVMLKNLRASDVITRYSSNQYIILMNIYEESAAKNINRRLKKKFYEINRNSKALLQFSVIKAE